MIKKVKFYHIINNLFYRNKSGVLEILKGLSGLMGGSRSADEKVEIDEEIKKTLDLIKELKGKADLTVEEKSKLNELGKSHAFLKNRRLFAAWDFPGKRFGR